MIATVAGTLWIDQDVGDVLHIAHFLGAFAYFQQRIEAGGARIGRVEAQAVREAGAPAGSERPVLALDVVNNGRLGPAQQRGEHQADALARSGWRDEKHVLGPSVA